MGYSDPALRWWRSNNARFICWREKRIERPILKYGMMPRCLQAKMVRA
jgi:hypothetical protein